MARTQRSLILLLACLLGLNVCWLASMLFAGRAIEIQIVLGLAMTAVAIASMAQTARLSRAGGGSIIIAVAAGAVLFVPWVGLLVLALINQRATRMLIGAGARVGFLGVGAEEMNKLIEGACGGCGYDVRGLTGSVCPECGQSLPIEPIRA